MKKIIIYHLLIFLIIESSYAQNAIDITKGQPAPYSGVLLSKEKAESIKNELIEKDKLKEINESYKRTVNLYKENEQYFNEQIKFLRNENNELNKKANFTDIEKIGWFTLGIILTGFTFKGIQSVSK